MNGPNFDLRPITLDEVDALCARFHGYGGAGGVAVYAFGVFEGKRIVAAYAWQPPPPGAAKAICPEAPSAVLALSRMVAVPRSKRQLRHISKPLRYQMRRLIDRTRWPVLVTYHDEGQGHTGHVYKCSGWQQTTCASVAFYVDRSGRRTSAYSNGGMRGASLRKGGRTIIHRWEHWVCERGSALRHMRAGGWRRERIPGRVWRSGNPAYRWVRG